MIATLLAIVLAHASALAIAHGMPATARADSAVTTIRCQLSNGDRISGSSGRTVGDTLVLDHETLGAVTVPAAAVRSCTASDSATRELLAALGKLAPPPAPPPTPRQRPFWRQSLAFSYSLLRGNADLNDFSMSSTVTRAGTTTHWTTHWFRRRAEQNGERAVGMYTVALRLNYALGDALIEDVVGSGPVVVYTPTSSAASASGARTTMFHEIGYDHDRATKLDRRIVLNTGLSFLLGARRSSRTALDVGVGLLEERFEDTTGRIIGGGIVRLNSSQQLPGGATMDERLALLPDVTQWWRYRLNADANVRAPLTKTVSLRLGFNNRFDTSPRPGVKKNDFSLQSGIGFDF